MPVKHPSPPNPLAPLLETQGFVVLDGGLATELERRGADLADPLWSAGVLLERPALIRDVHLAYFEAGADVAITASYQASIAGFARRGLSPAEAREAIANSVRLAQSARHLVWIDPDRPDDRLPMLVAGSVGPYGAALADGSEYRGGYGVSRAALQDFHGPRLEALIESGPNLLAIETIPSPDEALLVLELLERWPAMSAWVSFTCRDATRVSDGQPIGDALAAVEGHRQVVAVGFNCVAPSLVPVLLEAARRVTNKPLVVYPNSGERWDAQRRCWVGTAAAVDFGEAARRWHDAGARLIGGCCRTTPETIRAIRATLTTTSIRS